MKPGDAVGPYRILEKLGEGGMGEVYRATDSNLKRSVAIKVLPVSVAADPERLARFQREAEVLAALNHPNIAAIYGVERSPGGTALVMELVEGEDLSAIITRGPISIPDALPMARQIADALEAAHEQGIIHRDLKPANIKVRPDGAVKVLDFGLAKATDPTATSNPDAMNSPTLTVRATQLGVIIGTAAYMAPEQAKGKAVDRRADIWAFGVVLFEMLTGHRTFKGDDISDTLAAVLRDTPDFGALPPATPARLRDLLQRCLQKEPRARQRDIGDVRLELEAIAAGRADSPAGPPVTMTRARPPLATAAAVLVTIAGIGVAVGWMLPRDPLAPAGGVTRFIVASPSAQEPIGPVLSPDGRTLVFATDRLYKRDFDDVDVTAIPGTEGADAPMMSPDGRIVAFFANGKIKKVSLSGGEPTTIAEAASSMPGAAWGPDNTILFSRGWATGLSSVSVDGGAIRELTQPDAKLGERGHWRPRLLPDGQHALFTIWMTGSGVKDARVGLLDLKSGQHRVLFPGTDAIYLRSGHILFFHAGVWHVIPFDAAAGTTTGDAVTVLEGARGIDGDGGESSPPLAVSDSGTLAYRPTPLHPKRELVWADRSGRMESLGLPPRGLMDVALSPDGRRIVVSRLEGGAFELWMNEVARKTEDRLDIKGSNFKPIWSRQGDRFAFTSIRKGEYDVYAALADGTDVQPILTKDFDEQPLDWTRDGRRLIEKEWRPDGSTPVSVIDIAGVPDRRGEVIINMTSGGDSSTRLSPDDRWILYSNVIGGRREVFVQPFRSRATPTRVSSGGGAAPFWSRSGGEIVFEHDDRLIAVSFRQEGDRAVLGDESTLFALPSSSTLYGIGPDGRFLIGRRTEPDPPPGLRVVLNWFEELKRPVAIK